MDKREAAVAACPQVAVAVEIEGEDRVVHQEVVGVEPPQGLALPVKCYHAAEDGADGYGLSVGGDGGAVDEQTGELGVGISGPSADFSVGSEEQ